MSDEDKEIKRMKIEQNRNKRKLRTDPVEDKINKKIKDEKSPTSSITTNNSDDSDDQSVSSNQLKLSSESSVVDIVSAITEIPKESSRIIQQVMKTQDEALSVMSRIINDSNQALLLISHLIKNPSDGMLIISKMMSQSPLDALSVFTQFMSSPLDALQIIFKIMSSPKDVLKFMTELAKAPQNAMDIMRQFMSSPTESLQNMSRLISNSGTNNAQYTENETIKSMLDVSSLDSPKSIISMPSPSTDINSPSSSYNDSDSNNNDYQQLTTAILKEIAYDISGKKSQTFKVNSIDSIINEAIKLEYNTPEMITNYGNTCRELNEVEMMKIQELLDANCALYAPIEEDHLSFLGLGENLAMKPETSFVDPILLKVINLTAVAIRRLIKMSKKISGFKKMCQEDQIALLKVNATNLFPLDAHIQFFFREAAQK